MILVNLTCGRNPWKRASIEDATFRAYLKNPRFLSSILPLSPELDVILRRIFECVPERRISVSELRELILRCPRFTVRPGLTPPLACQVDCVAQNAYGTQPHFANVFQPSQIPPYTPPSTSPATSVSPPHSEPAALPIDSSPSFEGSLYSSSSCSSSSSDFESVPQPNKYVAPQPKVNFYGDLFPQMDWTSKHSVAQNFQPSIQVY